MEQLLAMIKALAGDGVKASCPSIAVRMFDDESGTVLLYGDKDNVIAEQSFDSVNQLNSIVAEITRPPTWYAEHKRN